MVSSSAQAGLAEVAARRHASRAALAIAPGVMLAGFAGGLAFPILPDVGLRSGMPLALIGSILAANRLGRIVSGPLVGAAADRLGGRRLLFAGLAAQSAVMLLYLLGVTTHHPALFFLLGRLLHGPGSVAVAVAAQSLALRAGGERHGGLSAGTVRAATAIGLPAGVALGGPLAAHFGEAMTFGLSAVAVAAATACAAFWVSKVATAPAPRSSWRSMVTLITDRRLLLLGALNFAVSFSALGVVLTTLILVVGARTASAGQWSGKATASVLLGCMVVTLGLVTLATSRGLNSRRARARASAVGAALLPPAMLAIGCSTQWPGLLAGVVVLGAAAGLLSASVLALLSGAVPPERSGAAVGWLQLCGDVGGVLGPIAGSSLLVLGAGRAYLWCAVSMLPFVVAALRLVRLEKMAVSAFSGGRARTGR